MTTRNERPVLQGCDVLPPMDDGRGDGLLSDATSNKPKGTPKRRRAADRFTVLNSFVDATLAGLCRGDIAVWLVLYRDTRDGSARTSQADIARRAGLSVRAVKKSLKRLKQLGLLNCIYQGGWNRGASRYRVRPYPPSNEGTY